MRIAAATRGPEPTPSAQRAPEPSRTPSPELATASTALPVAGVVGAKSSEPPCQPTGFGVCIRGLDQAAGWVGVLVGTIAGAGFTASVGPRWSRTRCSLSPGHHCCFLHPSMAAARWVMLLASRSLAYWPGGRDSGPSASDGDRQ